MLRYLIVAFCCCLIQILANEDSPRIIIIGAGAAGLAAGTRLLENGFNNITILEAEDRIGGRVYSTKFGGYPVDIGGQWVHGEKDNSVFELAWPLGLLERSPAEISAQIFSSAGQHMPEETANSLNNFFEGLLQTEPPQEFLNQTLGNWLAPKLDEYFDEHPDIANGEALKNMFSLSEMSYYPADDWFNVTFDSESIVSEGDQQINWKNGSYGIIIDILLKKFPNPDEELPFLNKTILNAEVSRINYNNADGKVRVVTENGDEYSADHVIITTSLGVLKSDHEKLFNPPLSDVKVNAIKNIEFGSVAKIYLYYPEPWWPKPDEHDFGFYWMADDRTDFATDPLRSWLLGMFSVITVEHKPGLLCCWVTSHRSRDMEKMPEEIVMARIQETLHRFLDKTYNLTEPTEMLRSQWFTNKHFRGTYSYRSPESRSSGASAAHLAEPIIQDDKPRVMFAGEASSLQQGGTVHGAISSGWREADRLIKIYKS